MTKLTARGKFRAIKACNNRRGIAQMNNREKIRKHTAGFLKRQKKFLTKLDEMEVGRKIESYHLLVHIQTSQNNKSWAWVWARTRDYNIIHNSHVSGRNPIT